MSAMASPRFWPSNLVPLTIGLALIAACTEPPSADGDETDTAATEDDDGTTDETGESGTTDDGTEETGVEAGLTYWKDAKDILDRKCVGCHQDGEIAPFALETWEQVENFAPVLLPSIDDRSMPPWPPAADCNSFEEDRSLTEDERATLLDWIGEGYPEGDPADAPEPPGPPDPFEPDVMVQLPVPYTPADSLDDYRCFAIPWPEDITEDMFVVTQEVFPDQREQVHHVITFVAGPDEAAQYQAFDDAEEGPGYTCYGGPGEVDWSARWLGDWAPGATRWIAPEGTGVRVEPGSLLIVQVHYNNVSGNPQPDQTAVGFEIVPEVEHPGEFVPIVDYNWVIGSNPMTIPAGEPDVMHDVTLGREHPIIQFLSGGLGVGPNETVDVWRTTLHMHTLGTQAQLTMQRSGGDDECMLAIDDWDFNWQGDYLMTEAMPFGVGDAIHLECHWDNTAENQPIVDGEPKEPEDVEWGDGTFDEMCLGIVYMSAR